MPVILRDIQGLSTEEASAILQVKPQTLKSRLHRGRLILRKHLANSPAGSTLHARESRQSSAEQSGRLADARATRPRPVQLSALQLERVLERVCSWRAERPASARASTPSGPISTGIASTRGRVWPVVRSRRSTSSAGASRRRAPRRRARRRERARTGRGGHSARHPRRRAPRADAAPARARVGRPNAVASSQPTTASRGGTPTTRSDTISTALPSASSAGQRAQRRLERERRRSEQPLRAARAAR